MPRHDLLALSPDDLASLANRGAVKRAQRELEAAEQTFEVQESGDGQIVVSWSDGIVCRFPAGESVHKAVCSSGMAGISRYVVRSVLAYQQHCAGSAESQSPDPSVDSAAACGPLAPRETNEDGTDVVSTETSSRSRAARGPHDREWDPGEISDDDLVTRFRQAAITNARARFQQGVLVELARGQKPVARFLDEPCTLRFLVPGDVRYVSADCAEPLLAHYVPLAVWAFRSLSADRRAGLVSIQQADLPTPAHLLDELETLLAELCAEGLAGCASSWPQRLTRLEASLRDAGLVWPAELVADLHSQHEAYRAHDARFDPLELVQLAGELLARSRAIRSQTKAVPQLLIRGTRADRTTDIAGGRLIGLGLGVRLGRRTVKLCAYLQDADTGSVVAVERTFADPPADSPDQPKDFASLAETVLTKGISMASLGASQLLLKSGKRTPSGVLVLPRTASSLSANPQAYVWEQLKPPAAVESFAQLSARLESLPPSYLRPRRLMENLHICALEGAESLQFDEAQQRLTAVLRDGQGAVAQLVHPYHSRGQAGFDALAAALEQRGGQARFVCGHVTSAGGVLSIQPVCLVLEGENGRTAVQPWVARAAAEASAASKSTGDAAAAADAPLDAFLAQLRFELSELLLSGVRRADTRVAHVWSSQTALGQRLGFVRLVQPMASLGEMLMRKADSLAWDSSPAVRLALQLCLLSRAVADCTAASA